MQQCRSGPESRVQVLGEGSKQGSHFRTGLDSGGGGVKFSKLTIKKKSHLGCKHTLIPLNKINN